MEEKKVNLAKNADAAILIYVNAGKILFSKNPNLQLEIASLTKLMTIFIILEKIKTGKLDWEEMVEVSSRAEAVSGSRVLLKAGEKLTVKDMFKAILICSGNDAAIAIAEKISGSVEEFVREMNRKAEELQLTNTHFMNPHGLPQKVHFSSVTDIATLSKKLLTEVEVIRYSKQRRDSIVKEGGQLKKILNTNTLLMNCLYVDGLKTGFSPGAGHCISATASINGDRILAIVLGEPARETRDKEVMDMIDYAWKQIGVI